MIAGYVSTWIRVLLMGVSVAALGRIAVAERIGPVDVNVQPLPTADNASGSSRGVRHGYLEYRVQLRNSSAKKLQVELSQEPYRGFGGAKVARTVRLDAGQQAAVSLFQPVSVMTGWGLTVRVPGEEPKTIAVSQPLDQTYGQSLHCAVLTSRGVPQDFRELKPDVGAASATPGAPSTESSEPFAFLRSETPVSQWNAHWLGYSCFDVIVVTGKEVDEMPGAVQLALRRYIECGGVVLVHAAKVPSVLSQGGTPDGVRGYQVGFGRVVAGYRGTPSWKKTRNALASCGWHEYDPQDKPSHTAPTLVAETTVPVRGLFILVLVFGIGIGPANLWLLSRYRRRIWLWWNVPAISLLTCLLVFAYSLASEGITGRGRVASFTLLDEGQHRATTIGYVSFYCPLTPSVGPQFSVDTDVMLLSNASNSYRRGSYRQSDGYRVIDWTNNQLLASGWVTARVPAYFQIRKSEDRRERLTVEKQKDGALKVVNALGADIERLYVADAEGRTFEAERIPAGAERTLAKRAGKKAIASDLRSAAFRALFNNTEWLGLLGQMRQSRDFSAFLAPGSYVAVLKKSPFVETPLSGVESEDTVAIVCGTSKESDHGR